MNNEQSILKKKQIIQLLSEFFSTVITPLSANEQMLTNWQIFQQLIEEEPIDLTKLYTFISKIQEDHNTSPRATSDLPFKKTQSEKIMKTLNTKLNEGSNTKTSFKVKKIS